MNKLKSYRVCAVVLAVAALVLASLGCGSTTERLQEAAGEPTATAAPAESTTAPPGEAEPTWTPAAETEPTSTPLPEPTSSPTVESEAIQLLTQGFGQDGQEVGYAFLVENPNAGLAFESSQYQVAAFDEGGAVVATDSSYIELVLPGQKLGVAGTIWLDEGVTATEVEVQLKEGDAVPTEPIPTFTVESTHYYDSEYFAGVTGLISSPYNRDLTDLRVSAVAYNDAGDIIGGGFTFVNFILADSSAGVDVSVTSSGDVASVELYPVVSGLTVLRGEEELPEGADDIVLRKQGFGQSDRDVGFGMLIENPNDNFSVESSQYHLTAFAPDGHVLTTEEGYVDVVLPEQTVGVGGELWLDEGMTADHVEIQLKAGTFVESEPLPHFSAENVTYQGGGFSPKVTGQIISPYEQDITDLRVSAIPYNEAGDIIGGGFTFLDFVGANGDAAVEVTITSAGAPATCELYAVVSGLSEFE